MNDQSWINDIQWDDDVMPVEPVGDEEIYTLQMADFLRMPDVDFKELASFDPHIRALMN